jgi:predicted AlkP superfamily pyrophosphatase or phosphodiesterase
MRRARGPSAILTLLVALLLAAAPAAPTRPKLIVILVVDQLRTDYVERFAPQWTHGLKRLLDRGAWFRRAAYPYLNTVTCAGHATISTGSVPAVHGMVLNEWWDRQTQRPVTCTQDEQAAVVTHTGRRGKAHSSRRLLVPALADEMRAQLRPEPRIVSLSMKARSALMMAGRDGDVVMWFESGAWTWPAPAPGSLMPAVAGWLQRHPVEADRDRVWDRSLPRSRYLYDDDPSGRRPVKGWGPLLPHPLTGDGAGFYTRWEHSPFADEYLARLAIEVATQLALGRTRSTDLLAVSFSALDRIGHTLGPRSHEVQDALVRLDAAVGALLDHLDRQVGRDGYVVALTSDHGVSPVPEQEQRAGVDAGRTAGGAIVKRVEDTLSRLLGPGRYVARLFYTDLYFTPAASDRLRGNRAAMKAVVEALLGTPGIARVYRGDELARGLHDRDPFGRAAAQSYHPGRSGDLILVPKPNWILSTSAATHGTSNPYDRHVPVVLAGSGVKPGTFLTDASPADIAPTLASFAGVRLARATGRVLNEAIASGSARQTSTSGSTSSISSR